MRDASYLRTSFFLFSSVLHIQTIVMRIQITTNDRTRFQMIIPSIMSSENISKLDDDDEAAVKTKLSFGKQMRIISTIGI